MAKRLSCQRSSSRTLPLDLLFAVFGVDGSFERAAEEFLIISVRPRKTR